MASTRPPPRSNKSVTRLPTGSTAGQPTEPQIDPEFASGAGASPAAVWPGLPKPTERPSDGFVQSFARGLSVIRAFDASRPSQTLSEVSAATGLTRAGARRILLTLQSLGYVQVNGRQFGLTPKVLELGFAYLTSLPFWKLAQPVMERLVESVHESCSASVLDGAEIVYVLRVPTRQIMTINLGIGSRLPAFCTSMGRMLLSALPDTQLNQVLRDSDLRPRTGRSETDIDTLKSVLAKVRAQGWALVDQELELGLISLSAPIRDRHGRVVAALNISGHASRTNARQMLKLYLEPLQQAAAEVSAMIGAHR